MNANNDLHCICYCDRRGAVVQRVTKRYGCGFDSHLQKLIVQYFPSSGDKKENRDCRNRWCIIGWVLFPKTIKSSSNLILIFG